MEMKLPDRSTVRFVLPDEISSGSSVVMLRQFPGPERQAAIYILRVVGADLFQLGISPSLVVNGSIRGERLVEACHALVAAWARLTEPERPRHVRDQMRTLQATLGMISNAGGRAEPETYLRLAAEAREMVALLEQNVEPLPGLLDQAAKHLAQVVG